jgi:vacuolar-type H+-ATPase subunit I/STV1
LDERVVEEMNNRKSPRHTSGELEKRRRVMLADLEKAIRDEEDKVEQQKKNLATTIRTKGIINKGEDSPPDPSYRSPNEDSITRSVPESKEQLEQRKMRLESQINSLLTYKSEQLRAYAAGVDLPDNAVKGLYPKYLEAQREIERLKSEGFVGNDPAFQARINQMESIRRLIDASIVILGKKLHAELELNENRMKVVTLRNASARDATIKTRSE